jgi:hypothetical protein
MKARLQKAGATAWSLECTRLSESKTECSFNLIGLPVGVYQLDILDYTGKIVYTAGSFEVI